MCHDLSPASVKGPPAGRTPVGRLASNSVRPRGGAPTMVVPTALRLGGPFTESYVDGTGVPVSVWYSTTPVSTTSTGSAYARHP